MLKTRIGIVGYGNVGKAVEKTIVNFPSLELKHIFSRREIPNDRYVPIKEILSYKDDIDVLILCGGSKTDLPTDALNFSEHFSFVDSYDNHNNMKEYLNNLAESALKHKTTTITGAGWDPGLFSIIRTISEAVLPSGHTDTFWGRGVSQGHSQAIRAIKGVADAVQYTVPIDSVLNKVRDGEDTKLASFQKHTRECYVVLEQDGDKEYVKNAIVTMPDYFADYYTIVHFISMEELDANHRKMPHCGFVIRAGETSEDNKQIIDFSLKLSSNPEFTATVMLAYSIACDRLKKDRKIGAFTILDIPPSFLIPENAMIDIRDYI